MSNESPLPADLLLLLRQALPGQELADIGPTSGGSSHRTAALSIGGRRCVVKAASNGPQRADVRRESLVLSLLGSSRLPTPPLLTLAEDDHWTAAVLGFLPGTNGLRFYSERVEELPAIAARLGALLAQVHRTPLLPPDDTDLLLEPRFDAVRAALGGLHLEAGLHQAFAAALSHTAWSAAPCLVHGDAGIHNVLWNGQVALLDWEWAGWGPPLLDLAWFAWTLRWRSAPPQLWQALLAAYGEGPAAAGAADEGALRALALSQIASILVRVRDLPVFAEWQRRAEWTVALPSLLVE